jgi:MHS family shikimate/dehydroshikimate transporter-like MFS transporter
MQGSRASVNKVAIASAIGTAVEWYDFFLYGTASALIFGRLFFPTFDPLSGTLASYGTFAVGFAARPIGGVICGHFGDRVGRKSMLVITLLIMGIATFLIGLLPTYDQVGIWAPALLVLLRIAQGFGLGGQWGGAVLMTLAIVEPPAFTAVKQTHTTAKIPILDALREHPKSVLLVMGARIAENGAFYLYSVFVLTYATLPEIGFSRSMALRAISIAALIQLFTIPAFGAWSDRVGRRPIYLFGAIFTAAFAFPFFWLIETSLPGLLVLSVVLALSVGHAAMYAPQASFVSELFGTRVRYSGLSLGYQLASVLAGGLSPIIATGLFAKIGNSWPIALYVVGMAAITTISVYLASETAHKDITAGSQ